MRSTSTPQNTCRCRSSPAVSWPTCYRLTKSTRLLAVPDITTAQGIRDRAIFETFYSTAVRASELSNLCLSDVDESRKLVHVRGGKGAKDRIVPIGKSALDWIHKYVVDVRPDYTGPKAGNRLFLGLHHRPIIARLACQVSPRSDRSSRHPKERSLPSSSSHRSDAHVGAWSRSPLSATLPGP